MVSKLDWALHWALHGFHVFPVQPSGKLPLLQDWPTKASCDPADVEDWWATWPDANIGAHPGASGHIVIDVDRKKGVDGALNLAKVEHEIGPLNAFKSLVNETPSGGLHFWFTQPGGLGNSASKIAEGVDTRGERGYAMMPGSSIGGNEYTIIEDNEVQPLPDAWLAHMERLNTVEERKASDDVVVDHATDLSVARKYLRDLVSIGDVAVEGSGGNDRTYRVASALREMGLLLPTALELTDEIWNPECVPPWTFDELHGVFENAYRYAQNELGAKSNSSSGSAFAGVVVPEGAPEAPVEPEHGRNRFTPLSIKDMQELPEPAWLVPGWLPLYAVTILYGKPGSLKSFAALDVALSLASARCAWGLDYMPDKRPVIYVAGEGQIGVGKQRVPAWLQKYGESPDMPFHMIPSVPRSADMQSDLRAMFSEIERLCGDALPRLIVYDTHARVMAGLDENSAQDTAKALELYDATTQRYSCAVLAIHHSGKDGSSERGSTALSAGVDTVLRMDYDVATRSAILRCEKQKDAEHPDMICFTKEKSGPSIVLTRKQHKPIKDVKAKSERYYDVVEVLTKCDASNAGRAMTVAAVAAALPSVREIDDQSEQQSARKIAEASIRKLTKSELKPLLNADGRLQLPTPSE